MYVFFKSNVILVFEVFVIYLLLFSLCELFL